MSNEIDQYLKSFPLPVRKKLAQMRSLIRKDAHLATEAMKYGMPTFILNGNLVHFAALKNHLGFFPTPRAILKYQKELTAYHWSKGGVQFPLEQPLPEKLISRIVKFRVKENLKKVPKQQ